MHSETSRERDDELPPEPLDAEGDEGIDVDLVKDAIGFTLRAPRRRPILAAAVFAVAAGLGLSVAHNMPRTYNAQVKLLAQRSLPLDVLGNPDAPRRDDYNPAHNVADLIMQRDNMIALVHEADLVHRFYENRPWGLRLKDKLFALVNGPTSDEDKVRNMIGTLWKRLQVYSDDNTGVVTINVDWNDPHVAYEIATLVQQNFLEARYDTETKMIGDTISVLEQHAKTELDQVDAALAEYEAVKAQRTRQAPAVAAPAAATASAAATAPAAAGAPAVAPAPPAPSADLTRQLEDVRRRLRAAEDERQREIESVQSQLSQAELTLTEMHPTVIGLRQRLEQLKQPTPELEQLRGEERGLMAQIAPMVAAPPTPASAGAAQSPRPSVAYAAPLAGLQPTSELDRERDPALAPARGRLDAAIHRYQDVEARIDSAKLQLDVTKTAFRYRYKVIVPAEPPRGPKKPIATIVTAASVPFAVVLSLLVAAAADLMSGRVLETWQVRRRLKLPILGELDVPELEPPA